MHVYQGITKAKAKCFTPNLMIIADEDKNPNYFWKIQEPA